ncbi:hypothetical protein OIDMADRAFT_174150 [Oidiodendron maius Zn]|uniref:Mitochondrial division protein 1 n=1 Tax=Oidiodendron maius (strain Zn) TaxID=913774 RepID=A0A0C3DYI7_OIDMZ|nr:hypothetical protein OIDMADRAFT_174150 [Oidiodendron maius Zn]
MRLLECHNDGEFSLTKNFSNHIPKYAILSHTWGADTEEVNFQDLIDSTGKSKDGYRKIRFCGEQARRDGLQYFWVDTCCIDKSSSAELAEAINSMFRWYRDATKCYVYLLDVSSAKRKRSTSHSKTWESAFRASRWFTRGWTLQELLAPSSVEFFSQEGKRLGDKKTLEQLIHQITGIAISAIHGAPLSQFGVEERLLWAENRQTTREEDKAYSLLGIFDVYMPLIYGEGRDNALSRFREEIDKPSKRLDHLPFATDAPFNSYSKQHAPICLPGTRVDLLQEIYNWADGQDKRYIFWLNGLAGTGKSTIAYTVARRFFEEKRLGASFFFSRGGGDVSHTGKFCTTVAMQLAERVPTLHRHISDAITNNSSIVNASLNDQWHQLVLRPLSKLDGNSYPSSYILVIDALDECDNNRNTQILLQLLAEVRSLKTVRLRVFLTSRPEVPIRYGYYQLPKTERYDLVLHNILPTIVDHDISIFLKYNLRLIGEEHCQDNGWPSDEVVKILLQSANGLFIWAATACRFIRDGLFVDERLQTLLRGGASITAAPEDHLNGIYLTVLQSSIQPGLSPQDKERFRSMQRHILGSIVLLLSPLSVNSLSKLLATPRQKVDRILKDLHAILDIPRDDSFPLRLHHPSFRDFLLDKNRCRDSNIWVHEKQAHQTLAESCLQLMSTSLKQDICKLDAPGILITEVGDSRVEQYLPAEVQYACLYWVEHFQKSGSRFQDNDKVYQFLETHLLHWLEALSWMRRTSEGIVAIQSLESIALTCKCSQLCAIIHDMKRFALYNRLAIEQAPLQIYYAALIFAPVTSIVKRLFKDRIPSWMRRLPVRENWGASLQTLEGHTHSIESIAFSHDSALLASASYDRTIRLWDTTTGAALRTLEGHTYAVISIAFSYNSALLASASIDKTIRLWDATTGTILKTLKGHKNSVNSVAFSHDGALLASASRNKIGLWDVTTGAMLKTLKGHTDIVRSVAFSHDGAFLASASFDATIRLWNATTGAALNTFEGHVSAVKSVVFSHESTLLASASGDNTIKLWDATTGAIIKTLEGHTQGVISVAFSHDSLLLASASFDKTIRLWDVTTGVALGTLKGHTDWVTSVAFSHDNALLASASGDGTIRLWDTTIGVAHDSALLASASFNNAIRQWDATTGAALNTLECHTNLVSSITFSHDGTLLASASDDNTIKLWDAATGVTLKTFEGHTNSVESVKFLQINCTHWVSCITFSYDNAVLASGSRDNTVRLWDVAAGTVLTLEGHTDKVISVAFSHDSTLLASGSEDCTVRIWDAAIGVPLKTMRLKYYPHILSFSPDGPSLEISCGLLHLEGLEGHYPLGISPQPALQPHIFLKGNWVLRNSERLLWLPAEYRGTCSAIRGNILASGHGDGRVTVMEFG